MNAEEMKQLARIFRTLASSATQVAMQLEVGNFEIAATLLQKQTVEIRALQEEAGELLDRLREKADPE